MTRHTWLALIFVAILVPVAAYAGGKGGGGGGGGPPTTGVIGSLDAVTCSTDTATGWSQDQNTPTSPNTVYFWVDSQPSSYTSTDGSVGLAIANEYDVDLCASLGSCYHAFTFAIPSAYLDGQTHRLYAYGRDTSSSNGTALSGIPNTFKCYAPPSCSVTFDQNPINYGDSTTVHWTSQLATSMYINTIGYVTPNVSGSATVYGSGITQSSCSGSSGQPQPKTIFLTSGTNWTVPSDWSDTNTVEAIGGGGNGGAGNAQSYNGGGGGGGAYAKSVNLTGLSGSVTIQIGGVASDTWFNSASFPGSGQAVGAKGGASGFQSTGGAGGSASASYVTGTGSAKYDGGSGATWTSGDFNMGGGGAAGSHGAGGGGSGTTGGTGDAGYGGGHGANGTEWDASHGSGGGGSQGEAGGLYGGSGGGGSNSYGAGTQGIVVITYTPSSAASTCTVPVDYSCTVQGTDTSRISAAALSVNAPSAPSVGINASSTSFPLGASTTVTATFAGNSLDPIVNDNIDSPAGTGLGATTPDATKVVTFTPSSVGTFTLFARAITGFYNSWTSFASTTITVVDAPACSISFDQNPIPQGSSTNIHWSSSGADTFSINNIGSVTPNASGSALISPLQGTDYTGTATKLGSPFMCPASTGTPAGTLNVSCTPAYTCSDQQTILYTAADCATTQTACVAPTFCSAGSSTCLNPSPTFNQSGGLTGHLQVSPRILPAGTTTIVTWNVGYVSSCSISSSVGNDSWSGASGSHTSSPITEQTIYTLACTGLDGSHVSESVIVNVLPKFQER